MPLQLEKDMTVCGTLYDENFNFLEGNFKAISFIIINTFYNPLQVDNTFKGKKNWLLLQEIFK